MDDGALPGTSDSRREYPRIDQAAGLILLTIVLMLIAGAIIRRSAPSYGNHPEVLEVANVVGIGLVTAWGYRKSGLPFRSVFPLKPLSMPLIGLLVLTTLGAVLVSIETNFWLRRIWPKPDSVKQIDESIRSASIWGAMIAVLVVAPLTEEFLFRGLILRGFLQNYSRRTAVLASAVLFGFFHVNPWQFASSFILGVLLGWWRVETGSLVPCLVGHALANAIPLSLSALLRRANHVQSAGAADASLQVHVGIASLGALLLFGGVWLVRKLRAIRGNAVQA